MADDETALSREVMEAVLANSKAGRQPTQDELATHNALARVRVAAFLRYALNPDHPDSKLGRSMIFEEIAASVIQASMFLEVMANHCVAVMLVGADGDHDAVEELLAALGDPGAMTDIHPQPTD